MRKFIRHPVDMPVEIGIAEALPRTSVRTQDISAGGVAVVSNVEVPPGTHIEIRIAYVEPPFAARARIAWCRAAGDAAGYEMGVTFLDEQDAFLARMVEQVCHIENYRKLVQRNEGRDLSAEDAAVEWIARHAADFPQFGHSRH